MVNKKAVVNDNIINSDSFQVRGRTDMSDVYLKEAKRRLKRASDVYNRKEL